MAPFPPASDRLPDASPRPPEPPDAPRLERAQLRRLHLASRAEAATLIALVCVAVPLKHLASRPAAVALLGPVHGLVFLAYCWVTAEMVAGGGWTRREVGRLVLAALVPFGGLTNGPLLRRKAATLGVAALGVAALGVAALGVAALGVAALGVAAPATQAGVGPTPA